MRRLIQAITVAITVIAVAPAIYAHGPGTSGDSMTAPGMMGQGGMMGMMGEMRKMMENCNKMMQSMNHGGSATPNEQWRHEPPATGTTPDAKR